MKNSIKFYALSLAALLGFASCQEEPAPEKEQPAATHTVKFTAMLPETKTIATIDGDVVRYAWKAEDAKAEYFRIYENGKAATKVIPVLLDNLMYIEATFPGVSKENAEYSALFQSRVQTEQNADAENYDQKSDVLVAQSAEKDENGRLGFSFERQVAFAKITLKGLEKGHHVSKVTIEDLDGKAIAAEYDWTNKKFPGIYSSSVITISCSSVISNGEASVWLTTIPLVKAKLKFTVGTADESGNAAATYVKELVRPLTLECNNVMVMGVELKPQPIKTSALYIVGPATPTAWWEWSDKPSKITALTPVSEYVFQYEGTLNEGAFRATPHFGWGEHIRPLTDNVEIGEDGASDDKFMYVAEPDYNWQVKKAGKYRITFDLEHWTISAEYLGLEPIETSTLFMLGSATKGGWKGGAMTPMQQDGSDPYLFTFEGTLSEGELKLYTESGNYDGKSAIRPVTADTEIGKAEIVDAPFIYTLDPDNKWKVKAGKYRLSFNLGTYTMSSNYLGEPEYEWPEVTPIQTETLYLLGDAVGGWNTPFTTVCTKKTDTDYVFVYEGALSTGLLRASTFSDYGTHIRPKTDKLEIGKGGCESEDFVNVSIPDNNWNVVDAGNYRITFDLEKWTVKFEYLD